VRSGTAADARTEADASATGRQRVATGEKTDERAVVDPDRAAWEAIVGKDEQPLALPTDKQAAEQKPENTAGQSDAFKKLAAIDQAKIVAAMAELGLDETDALQIINTTKKLGEQGRELGELRQAATGAKRITEKLKDVVMLDPKTGDMTGFDGLKLLAVATQELGRDGVLKALHSEGLTIIPLAELTALQQQGPTNGGGLREKLLRDTAKKHLGDLQGLVADGVTLDAAAIDAMSAADLRRLIASDAVVNDDFLEGVDKARTLEAQAEGQRQRSQQQEQAKIAGEIKTRLEAIEKSPGGEQLMAFIGERTQRLYNQDGSLNRNELTDVLADAAKFQHLTKGGLVKKQVAYLVAEGIKAEKRRLGIPLEPGEEPSREAIVATEVRQRGPSNPDEGSGPSMT
jgi:hypothetical protein